MGDYVAGVLPKVATVKHPSSLRSEIAVVLAVGVAATPSSARKVPLVKLTTGIIGNGTVERHPDQTSYEISTTVNPGAIAVEGLVFPEWSGRLSVPLITNTTVLLKSNTLVGPTFFSTSNPRLKVDPTRQWH